MNKILQLLIFFLALMVMSCTNSLNNRLSGKYIRSVNSGRLYSHFIFYPNNHYFFYSSSCFESNKDTGSFVFSKDTIFFTSFNKEAYEKSKSSNTVNKTLSGEKMIFQDTQIMYILKRHYRKAIVDNLQIDTFYWIKDIMKY